MDQRELVERAGRGDHDAFAALVGASIAQLEAFARLILRDPELARDAVQEAYIRAWRDLRNLRDPERFDAWLHRLTVNACLDCARRRRRRPIEVDIEPIEPPFVRDDTSLIADRDLLERGFQRLRTEHRAVLVITLGRRTIRPVPWRTVGVLALIALLIAAMLAAYVGSHPKVPPPFGFAANGFLAYGVNGPSGSAGDVVAVNPTTGATVTLVGGPNDDSYPTYSHDGTRIVFDRKAPGGDVLFAIAADGKGVPIQLTKPDPIGVYGLVWSPDDKQIAYINPTLWVAASDGSGAKKFDLGVDAYYPIWRPGRSSDIAFNGASDADSTKNGYYLVRSDGSNLRPILMSDGRLLDGGPIQFTPDGGRIVITIPDPAGGSQTARVHAVSVGDDGRVTRDQAIGPEVLRVAGGFPVSPDGTRVVAAVPVGDGGEWRIGVISIDQSPVVLTGPAFDGSGVDEGAFGVAWSPDGSVIAVNDSRKHELWFLDVAGGDHRLASWNDLSGEAPMWQRVAP